MVTGTVVLALLVVDVGPALAPRWDRPACFAYSPADRAYACFDFDLQADDVGQKGIRPMDFERWAPPAGTAWGGHKAVDLVGPGLDTALMIAEHPYGRGHAIVRGRSARSAMRRAAARGFTVPLLGEVPLPSGQWIEVGGARLRFTTRYHLGDASEYSIGSLQIDCRAGLETTPRLVELLTELRGASAVAFAAPAAGTIVVGVLEEGGGEGSRYVGTEYLHVDPHRVCGGQ